MGRVRVAAPERLDDEQVRLAVVQRLPWIKRQREQLQAAERQSEREMVTGESHYVWGLRLPAQGRRTAGTGAYRDRRRATRAVRARRTPAEKRRDYLDKLVPRPASPGASPTLIAKWEPTLDVTVPKWTIRRMKTKWGSCNRETRHIWFNVELAKKHPRAWSTSSSTR